MIWQLAVLPANKPYLPLPYLPLLPSHTASPPFGSLVGSHFTIPRRVECWVDLGGWLHTEIKCRPDSRTRTRSPIRVLTGLGVG